MAEQKSQALEREYIIPLRKEWQKVANYRRAGRAVKAIKKFIAKHMKVPDRDVDKVKLDTYLNQEVWFKGKRKPPAKLKVRAVKEGEIVKVFLVDEPIHHKFVKAQQEKRHKSTDKPVVTPKKSDAKSGEQKTEEEKKEESEKEKAVADVRAADAKQEVKAQKHLSKVKGESHHRMALQK